MSRKIGGISTTYVLRKTKGKLQLSRKNGGIPTKCVLRKTGKVAQLPRKIGGISTKYVLRKTKGKLHSYLVRMEEYLPSVSLGKQRGSCTIVS